MSPYCTYLRGIILLLHVQSGSLVPCLFAFESKFGFHLQALRFLKAGNRTNPMLLQPPHYLKVI